MPMAMELVPCAMCRAVSNKCGKADRSLDSSTKMTSLLATEVRLYRKVSMSKVGHISHTLAKT